MDGQGLVRMDGQTDGQGASRGGARAHTADAHPAVSTSIGGQQFQAGFHSSSDLSRDADPGMNDR